MLFGLILCGGKSSRMGSDKGLLMHNNMTWSEYLKNSLSVYCDEIFVSINEFQAENYSKFFLENTLIIDLENDKGPLGGILSAHQKYPNADWFIIPCDMFDIENRYLESLKNAYIVSICEDTNRGNYEAEISVHKISNKRNNDALVGVQTNQLDSLQTFYYLINQQVETFPCVLKAQFLSKLFESKIENWSLQKHLKDSKNYQIEINNPNFAFKNYNSKNELQK